MGVMMGTRGGLDARWVNEFGRGMPPPHMEGVAIRFFGGGELMILFGWEEYALSNLSAERMTGSFPDLGRLTPPNHML